MKAIRLGLASWRNHGGLHNKQEIDLYRRNIKEIFFITYITQNSLNKLVEIREYLQYNV